MNLIRASTTAKFPHTNISGSARIIQIFLLAAASWMLPHPALGTLADASGSSGGAGTFYPVDLSPHQSSFSTFEPAKCWAAVPRGKQMLANVMFQSDGILELTGMGAARDNRFFPARATGITVGRKAQRLHLLHGTGYDEKEGAPVAQIVLRYASGETRSLYLAFGVHTRDWWQWPNVTQTGLSDPNSCVAWTGRSPETDATGVTLRLFKTTWRNPLPDQPIEQVEFRSLMSRAAPVIIAFTLEDDPAAKDLGPAAATDSSQSIKVAHYRGEMILLFRDAKTEQAAPDAHVKVTVEESDKTYAFGEYQADAQGRIILDYPVKTLNSLCLQISDQEHLGSRQVFQANAAGLFPAEQIIKLESGVKIGGLVQTPKGSAITGVTLEISGVMRDEVGQFVAEPFGKVVTNREGKWSCASVPLNFAGFNFKLSHPEYFPAEYDQSTASSIESNQVSKEDLLASKAIMVLQPGITVEGTVTDRNGQSIARAKVALAGTDEKAVRHDASCDDQGKFRVVLLEQGDFNLVAQAKGYAPEFQTTSIEPGMAPIQFSLAKAKILRGSLKEKNGQPISGVTVAVATWNNTRLLNWQTQTDAKGRFEWDSAPDGAAQYSITKADYLAQSPVLSADGSEVSLILNKVPRISGRVIDAETKQPVREFTLVKGRIYSSGESANWESYNPRQGRNGQYVVTFEDQRSPQFKLKVETPDYFPASSPAYKEEDGWVTFDFELKKGKGLAGVVQWPDGTPVPGVTVLLADEQNSAYMDREGQFRTDAYRNRPAVTDKQGHFQFSPRLETFTVFAAHEKGYAEVPAEQVAATGKVVLQPWGRIKGVVRVGEKVGANQSVSLGNMYYRYSSGGRSRASLSLWLKAKPAEDGTFVFEKAPPGERKISLQYQLHDGPGTIPLSHGFPVVIKPGETTEVTIGGTGRPVIGKVRSTGGDHSEVDWKQDVHQLTLLLPADPDNDRPEVSKLSSDAERNKAWQDYYERSRTFWNSEPGRILERQQRSYVLLFEADGSFRIDNVPPGKYRLAINPTEPSNEPWRAASLGSLTKEVEIPAPAEGHANAAFDLGTCELKLRKILKEGSLAPDFEAQTLDGKPLKLAQHRGKYILLYLWSTAWGPERDLSALKSVFDAFGQNPRFVMMNLSLDAKVEAPQEFARKNELKWLQGFLPATIRNEVVESYQTMPAAFLIDPEGKIVAKNLQGSALRAAVEGVFRPRTTMSR